MDGSDGLARLVELGVDRSKLAHIHTPLKMMVGQSCHLLVRAGATGADCFTASIQPLYCCFVVVVDVLAKVDFDTSLNTVILAQTHTRKASLRTHTQLPTLRFAYTPNQNNPLHL